MQERGVVRGDEGSGKEREGEERREKMREGKMTRRVFVSEIEGGNVRGRPAVKWRGVQEYVRERGEGSLRNLEQAKRVCQDRWGKKRREAASNFVSKRIND